MTATPIPSTSALRPLDAVPRGMVQPDAITGLSLLYLGLPLPLFFTGWLRLPIELIALVLVVIAFMLALRRTTWKGSLRGRWGLLAALGVAAIAWSAFGGAGHFFYTNRYDWSMRDAVLRDLTVSPWPVAYAIGDGLHWLLRCPVAYYLPAALAGKVLGFASADVVLWMWTALGVWLFLALLPIGTRRPAVIAAAVLVIIAFSGMDIVGFILMRGENPPAWRHLEWWVKVMQYSSNTTLLLWGPNHALPAWIAAGLFWRHWKTDAFVAISPLLVCVLPLWSPFALMGVLPFYALLGVRLVREKKLRTVNVPILAISAVLTLVVMLYETMDAADVPAEFLTSAAWFQFFLPRYFLFVILEFGILAVLLWKWRDGPLFGVSIVMLLILPFIRVGAGNDLVMRASITPLAFLSFTIVEGIQRAGRRDAVRLALVSIVLLIGAVTPFHEFYRVATFPNWKPSATRAAIECQPVPAPHYFAREELSGARAIFTPPDELLTAQLPLFPLQFRHEEYP